MTARPPNTRNDLIEAALQCFAEHGYDGTSIRRIAQRAGRPLSLIGHHFGGKEGLYLEVFRFLTANNFGNLTEGEALPPGCRLEAIRLFREQIHALYVDSCPEDPAQESQKLARHKLFLSEMRNPRPEIMELLRTRLQPWVNRMKGCIQLLRPDLTDAEVTLLGTSIMGQIASQGLLAGVNEVVWGRHVLGVAKSAELLAQFSLQGLGVPPEESRLHLPAQ
jgi:AcrR family transcriptional regulator